MATVAVIKPLKGPFRQLPYKEAERMVAEGRAMRPDPRGAPGVFYELEAKPIEKQPQVYETRMMKAKKPTVRLTPKD